MITAIVTSDNHLGAYHARYRPDILERRRRRLQAGFGQVVDAAIVSKADIFLHAGDLYDTPAPRNAERKYVAEQFQKLMTAGIPAFCIAGNHDSPRSYGFDGGIAPLEEMSAVGAAHLFRACDKWEQIQININGVKVGIRGISHDFNIAPDCCPLESLVATSERGGAIDIVLLHYGVEKWGDFAGECCLSLANLDALKADAVCVGHLHTPNRRNLANGGVLLNPGATEHINFGEEHLDCGYWILRCEPGNIQAEYIKLAPQTMRTLEIDMGVFGARSETENGETPALHDELIRRIEEISAENQIMRAVLSGRLNRKRYPELDIAALKDCGQKGNFHFQLDTDKLDFYDELTDSHIEIGFNFDIQKELKRVVDSLTPVYAEDADGLAIHREAGEAIQREYARIAGGN